MRQIAILTVLLISLACRPAPRAPEGLWVSHGQWRTIVRDDAPPLDVAAAVVVRMCGDGSLVIADTELHRFEQNIWVSTSRNYRGVWHDVQDAELSFEYAFEGLIDGKPRYPTVVSRAFLHNDELTFDLLRQAPRLGHGKRGERSSSGAIDSLVPLTLHPGDTLPAKLDTFLIPCGDTHFHAASVNTLY